MNLPDVLYAILICLLPVWWMLGCFFFCFSEIQQELPSKFKLFRLNFPILVMIPQTTTDNKYFFRREMDIFFREVEYHHTGLIFRSFIISLLPPVKTAEILLGSILTLKVDGKILPITIWTGKKRLLIWGAAAWAISLARSWRIMVPTLTACNL